MFTLLCAVLGAAIAAVIGVAARSIGGTLGLLDFPDDPGGRKLHAGVTPLVGGLAVTLATLAAIAVIAAFANDRGGTAGRDLVRLAGAVGVMFLIGAADDRFDLSVRIRLGLATVVLAFVIASVPDFALTFMRFGQAPAMTLLGWASVPFTLLCVVGLLNAVNMADGKNGIVIGLALIWSAFLIVHLSPELRPVLAAVAGALAVLFVFNLRGRLFLGDGGSYAVSALFGLLAVATYNRAFADIGADDVALLFAVPVFDTLRLVVSRMVERKSPFAGGRDHLHHYLHATVGWPRGLYIYLALAGLPVVVAALVPGTALIWLGSSFVAYVAVLVWAR